MVEIAMVSRGFKLFSSPELMFLYNTSKCFFLLTSQDIIAIQNVQDYVNGKLNRLQVMWIPLEKTITIQAKVQGLLN
jgi:hypothetical protein